MARQYKQGGVKLRCKYCTKPKSDLYYNGICDDGEWSTIVTMFIKSHKTKNKVLHFEVENSYHENDNLIISTWGDNIKINYCPMCGEKL